MNFQIGWVSNTSSSVRCQLKNPSASQWLRAMNKEHKQMNAKLFGLEFS